MRYCNYCGQPITDPTRLAHSAVFCGHECKRAADADRRSKKALVKCRLCGRYFGKGRRKAIESTIDSGLCAATAQEV